jgi:hypothetical protein
VSSVPRKPFGAGGCRPKTPKPQRFFRNPLVEGKRLSLNVSADDQHLAAPVPQRIKKSSDLYNAVLTHFAQQCCPITCWSHPVDESMALVAQQHDVCRVIRQLGAVTFLASRPVRRRSNDVRKVPVVAIRTWCEVSAEVFTATIKLAAPTRRGGDFEPDLCVYFALSPTGSRDGVSRSLPSSEVRRTDLHEGLARNNAQRKVIVGGLKPLQPPLPTSGRENVRRLICKVTGTYLVPLLSV